MKKFKEFKKNMPCSACKKMECSCSKKMSEAVVDKTEIGYKGEMAISQCKQIEHHLG